MSSGAELHTAAELQLAYRVANAPLNVFPYPHIYVADIFPAAFYEAIQRNLPEPEEIAPIEEIRPVRGYKERFVMEIGGAQVNTLSETKREFWATFNRWLVGARFGELVTSRFGQLIDQRFKGQNVQLYDEALLIEDIMHYSLGPHTDSPRKVMSFLFYLPKDETQRHLGTSIYVPREAGFHCPGGPHHAHERFDRMWTAPFLPNSMFAFFKNDVSFHGVEPVEDPDCRRWLLLWDLYVQLAEAAKPAAPITPEVKFTF